jgi:prolipoprotein diacylglyceryl transferase
MIEWNVSPEIFSIGPISIRWYGLLFALTFIIGFFIMSKIFKKEGKSEEDLNDLVWYMILGTVIGARLGHCLFYNPSYYLSNPLEIIQVWKGGLASHGAAVGILLAVYFYSKKKKDQSYFWTLDRVAITVALGAFFVRMGNLFNSEIIGKPADVPWSFIFNLAQVTDPQLPRHPAQLYEALAYFFVFLTLLYTYTKQQGKTRDGFLMGLFMVLVFTFRFCVEFLKENQSHFEDNLALNMGQLLSIPLVIAGVILIFNAYKTKQKG